jgi:hypothetical protein
MKNKKEQDINPKVILKTLQQVKTQLEQMKKLRPICANNQSLDFY